MTSLGSTIFVVQTAYGAISVVLYMYVVILLLKNWSFFRGSFFRLFIASFFINIWTYLNSFVTLRLPQNTCENCTLSGVFQDFTVGLNIFHTLHFHFAFLQYLMSLVMSFNRMTMILFPFFFEQVRHLQEEFFGRDCQ
ncbi:hypothetical protein COOONC_19510 [Cooperia oncophora]